MHKIKTALDTSAAETKFSLKPVILNFTGGATNTSANPNPIKIHTMNQNIEYAKGKDITAPTIVAIA